MLNKKSKIFVTGHKGLVGSAVLRRLYHLSYKNILTVDKKKLDLRKITKQEQAFTNLQILTMILFQFIIG